MNAVAIYLRSQCSFLALAETMDDSCPIAATPDWDARALLAHVVGVAHDVATGNVDGYATIKWTRTQVEERVGATREDLLAEWETVTPAFTAVLEDPTARGLDALFIAPSETDEIGVASAAVRRCPNASARHESVEHLVSDDSRRRANAPVPAYWGTPAASFGASL